MNIGDKVRWRNRNTLCALAVGDVVMTITAKHPIMGDWWQVTSPDGYTTWVPGKEVWVLHENTT